MAAGDRDRDAAKFGKRDWNHIAAAWAEYLPVYEHDIAWPNVEIDDLPQLRPVYEYLRNTPQGELQELEELNFLHTEVLMASLAYTRRAAHVLRAAAKHTEFSFRSWSRVSAYQAAFFAMQSILRLLGAVVLYNRERKETFQLDLWSVRELTTKSKVLSAADAFTIKGYLRKHGSLKHSEFWSIFSRLLRATVMPPEIWPYFVADRFKRLSGEIYPSLRNKLHYRASSWPFDDLINQLPSEDINVVCTHCASVNWTDAPDDGDFPLYLSLHVVLMALALFRSITPAGSLLRAEIDAREDDLRGIGAQRQVAFAPV